MEIKRIYISVDDPFALDDPLTEREGEHYGVEQAAEDMSTNKNQVNMQSRVCPLTAEELLIFKDNFPPISLLDPEAIFMERMTAALLNAKAIIDSRPSPV